MAVKEVKDLAIEFKAELLTTLERENSDLKKQVEQLKNQLTQQVLGNQITPEELVCIEQIRILQNRSAQRELSLEEVKKLDLLVKNIRLIREQVTENPTTPKWREVFPEADLVAIASKSES